MLLRKPAVLLNSSSAISNGVTCCTSQTPPIRHFSTNGTPPCKHQQRRPNARSYATLNDDTRFHSHDNIPWPDLSPETLIPPTPYQIFSQKPSEPYSKRRFYELVKLYHPDRHKHVDHSDASSQSSKHTRAVLLERYRLVIAANSILSDPLKREAYDRFGAGWSYDPSHHESSKYKYSTYHRWRKDGTAAYQWPTDQDPMFNATWEDWERWYRQRYENRRRASSSSSSSSSYWSSGYFNSGRPRSPLYASNHAFISAVFILAALGGVGQATRVQDSNRLRLERTQLMNDRANESLMQARQDTLDRKGSGETKDKRIKRFLKDHEDYQEGEFDGRALREGDEGMCAGAGIKDKDQPKFWQKPPENR